MPTELSTGDKVAAFAFLLGYPSISTGINTLGAQLGNSVLPYVGGGLSSLNSPDETILITAQSSAVGYAALGLILLAYEIRNKKPDVSLLSAFTNQVNLLITFDILGSFFLPFLAQWYKKGAISPATASAIAAAAGAIPIYLFAAALHMAFYCCHGSNDAAAVPSAPTTHDAEIPSPAPRNTESPAVVVNIYSEKRDRSANTGDATEIRPFSPVR